METLIESLATWRLEKWRRRAACLGVGNSHFFLERGQSAEPAREMCRRCPVTDDCHQHSHLDFGYAIHGIWADQKASEINRETRIEQSRG